MQTLKDQMMPFLSAVKVRLQPNLTTFISSEVMNLRRTEMRVLLLLLLLFSHPVVKITGDKNQK